MYGSMFLKPPPPGCQWIGLVWTTVGPNSEFGPHPPVARVGADILYRPTGGSFRGWSENGGDGGGSGGGSGWHYSGYGRSGQRVGKVNHLVLIPRVQVLHHPALLKVWKEASEWWDVYALIFIEIGLLLSHI